MKFTIDPPGEHTRRVLYPDGGIRPATDEECALWDALRTVRAQARAELIGELKPVAWHVHGRRGKRTYVLIPFDSEAAAKEEASKLHDATIIPLAIIPDTKE